MERKYLIALIVAIILVIIVIIAIVVWVVTKKEDMSQGLYSLIHPGGHMNSSTIDSQFNIDNRISKINEEQKDHPEHESISHTSHTPHINHLNITTPEMRRCYQMVGRQLMVMGNPTIRPFI